MAPDISFLLCSGPMLSAVDLLSRRQAEMGRRRCQGPDPVMLMDVELEKWCDFGSKKVSRSRLGAADGRGVEKVV